MMRSLLLLSCLFLVFSLGCSEKEAAPVSTGLDQTTIDAYQAQSQGEGYENYVEPK
ncbi:hypothetical protein SH528x_002441 [Novipirellula sp. SH528]|uniref:hypothetical protein n=1 Tax=Novipirellula sp. SH528 TaxID=3454466 RepID=UPI003FA16CFC